MTSFSSFTSTVAVLAATTLVACGGGGDSSESTSTATVYGLNAMQAGMVMSGQSFTASATSGANTYQMFLSITPTTDAVFEGAPRKRAVQSLTIRENGSPLTATTFTGYYDSSQFQLVGADYAGGGHLVATTHAPLPTFAAVGSSGSLGTQTLYADSTKATVLARQQSTWTLESAASGSANYCVNTVLSDAANVVIGTTIGCNRINTSGNIIGIRWTITVNGATLTFQ